MLYTSCAMPFWCDGEKWTATTDEGDGMFGFGVNGNECGKPYPVTEDGRTRTPTRMGAHETGRGCFSMQRSTMHGKQPGTTTPLTRSVILIERLHKTVQRIIFEHRTGVRDYGLLWHVTLGYGISVHLFKTVAPLRAALAELLVELRTKGGGDKTMDGGSPQWWGVSAMGECAVAHVPAPPLPYPYPPFRTPAPSLRRPGRVHESPPDACPLMRRPLSAPTL